MEKFICPKYNMATSISTSASATPGTNRLVCPLYSNLDASANALVEILQQSAVTMNYDRKFTIALNDTSSGHILNAFVVSGDGATLAVDMRNNVNFQAMVKHVIDKSLDGSGNSLQSYLYNDVQADIKRVYEDDIANILQSNWFLNVAVNSTGGASNLYTDLCGNAAQRLLMAQQVPNETWSLYYDASENSTTDALPLAAGDKIVFLFDVTAIVQTRVVAAVQSGTSASAGVSTSQGAPANAAGSVGGSAADVGANAANANNRPELSNAMNTDRMIAAFEITVGSNLEAGDALTSLNVIESPVNGPNLIDPDQTGATSVPQSGVDSAAASNP